MISGVFFLFSKKLYGEKNIDIDQNTRNTLYRIDDYGNII